MGTVTSGTWSATAIGATKGGTAQTSWTTGDLLYASGSNTLAKLAIGTSGQLLKVSSGIPAWSSSSAPSLAIASKTANYTVANTDDVILADSTGVSSFTLTLPDCASNGGKVFYFKNKTTDTHTVTISRAGSDTIDGLTSVIMASANDELIIVSGGGSIWYVLNWGVQTTAVAYRASSDQSVGTSATEIVFNTLDNQTNSSAYSTSTGRFTVIYPGRYEFIASLQLSWTSAPTEIDVWFQKNGAGTLYGHQYKVDFSANKSNLFTVNTQLQLAAGDYVSAWGQYYTNSGTLDSSSNRRSQLIVKRIGN